MLVLLLARFYTMGHFLESSKLLQQLQIYTNSTGPSVVQNSVRTSSGQRKLKGVADNCSGNICDSQGHMTRNTHPGPLWSPPPSNYLDNVFDSASKSESSARKEMPTLLT